MNSTVSVFDVVLDEIHEQGQREKELLEWLNSETKGYIYVKDDNWRPTEEDWNEEDERDLWARMAEERAERERNCAGGYGD